MSRYVFIRCDVCEGGSPIMKNERDALLMLRHKLNREGWKCTAGGRDVCPDCRPKKESKDGVPVR